MRTRIFIQTILPLVLFAHVLHAQTVLEVATKTLEKQIPFNPQGTIFLNGENATIKISTWNKNEVQVRLKLIIKHPEKVVVAEQIDNMKYLIEKKGSELYLRNYYLTTGNPPAGCIMKAEYELTVPFKSNFSIKNNLGNISLENIEGTIDIETKFGDVTLYNVKGNIKTNLSLGSFTANQIEGLMNTKASNCNINMENLKGKYYFATTNSSLVFRPMHSVELLNVSTKNGNVKLLLNPSDAYNYSIASSYGEIKLPDEFKNTVVKEKNKSFFKYKKETVNSSIVINSDFGNIILINNPTEYGKQN